MKSFGILATLIATLVLYSPPVAAQHYDFRDSSTAQDCLHLAFAVHGELIIAPYSDDMFKGYFLRNLVPEDFCFVKQGHTAYIPTKELGNPEVMRVLYSKWGFVQIIFPFYGGVVQDKSYLDWIGDEYFAPRCPQLTNVATHRCVSL